MLLMAHKMFSSPSGMRTFKQYYEVRYCVHRNREHKRLGQHHRKKRSGNNHG